MDTLQQARAPSRVGVVTYALALTISARRIAIKTGADATQLARAAVIAYRATGNLHDGKRAIFAAGGAA